MPEDAPRLGEISVLGWQKAYTHILPADLLQGLSVETRAGRMRERLMSLEGRSSFWLVGVDENDLPWGFAECGPPVTAKDAYDVEIHTFYVHPEAQGCGIGRRLMLEAVRRFVELGHRSMIVWTFRDNAACAFYEKMGGRIVRHSTYTVGDVSYPDVAYGWDDLPAWLVSQS